MLIVGYKKIQDELRSEVSELMNYNMKLNSKNEELQDKVKVLEGIAGEVRNSENSPEQLVVITEKKNKNSDELQGKEISDLRNKLDESNRKNSVLKDELAEKSSSLDSVDSFYKDIIDQKERVVEEYLTFTNDMSDDNKKLRRLLVKFRNDNEVKFMKDLVKFSIILS